MTSLIKGKPRVIWYCENRQADIWYEVADILGSDLKWTVWDQAATVPNNIAQFIRAELKMKTRR